MLDVRVRFVVFLHNLVGVEMTKGWLADEKRNAYTVLFFSLQENVETVQNRLKK